MPIGYPDTASIVRWFDRWSRGKNFEERDALDLHSLTQERRDMGGVAWWRKMWQEHTPETHHIGRMVQWTHQRPQWAPYEVTGVEMNRACTKVVAVILADVNNCRWRAAIADVSVRPPAREQCAASEADWYVNVVFERPGDFGPETDTNDAYFKGDKPSLADRDALVPFQCKKIESNVSRCGGAANE
jgi:hypothetical protein